MDISHAELRHLGGNGLRKPCYYHPEHPLATLTHILLDIIIIIIVVVETSTPSLPHTHNRHHRTDHSKMTAIAPPILHRHNSQHTPLTPAQEQSRQSYLSTPDLVKYAAIDRVLDRRGGRTDEAFVGGEEVSQESESKSSSFGRGPGRREEPC